jgi:hypothetical protein
VAVLLLSLALLSAGTATFPNIGYLGCGYDIIKGSPDAQSMDEGFVQNPFSFSYSQNLLTPDGRYTIPDGTQVEGYYYCSYDTEVSDFAGSQSFQSEMKTHVSLTVGFPIGSFTASVDYQKVTQEESSYHYRYTSALATCSLYRGRMLEFYNASLTPEFRYAVSLLQAPCAAGQSCWSEYMKVLGAFGTHYVETVIMGGRMILRSAFTEDKWHQMTSTDLNIAATASLSFKIYSGSFSGSVEQKEQVQKDFDNQRSAAYQLYIGGAPFVTQDQGGLQQWAAGLQDRPMPISYSLLPLSDLLSQLYFPTDSAIVAKSTAMAAAISAYCANFPGCVAYPADPVRGCSNPIAHNYNPQVQVDDGSCVYSYGGMFASSTHTSFPNPFTKAASCPAGFTAQIVSNVVFLVSSAFPPLEAGNIYLCVALSPSVQGFAMGGFYTVDPANLDPVVNPFTGTYSCPLGFHAAVLAQGVGSVDHVNKDFSNFVDIFQCMPDTAQVTGTKYGGFFQVPDNADPRDTVANPLTRTTGCPAFRTAQHVSRVMYYSAAWLDVCI